MLLRGRSGPMTVCRTRYVVECGRITCHAADARRTWLIPTLGVTAPTMRQLARLTLAFALMALLASCAIQKERTFDMPLNTTPVWQLVYRHDTDGKPLAGSKSELIGAIRRGAPIRFAWGFKVQRDGRTITVEHVAEPVFLSVINESDIVVHLPEHIAQRAYGETVGAMFDNPAVMWRGLMTSQGVFDAVWVNRATGEQVRRHQQRVGLAWFALQAKDPAAREPALELAVPGGVVRVEPPK